MLTAGDLRSELIWLYLHLFFLNCVCWSFVVVCLDLWMTFFLLFSSDLEHLAGEFLCIRLSPVCCPGLNRAMKELERQNEDITRLIISRMYLVLFSSNLTMVSFHNLNNLLFKVFCS